MHITIADLVRALLTLDQSLTLTPVLYLKQPSGPPRLILGDNPKRRGLSFEMKLSPIQLAQVRELARNKNFTEIAKHFKVHRSTISRYLKSEFEVGRMSQSAGGLVETDGAYDLQTKLPIGAKL